MWQIFSKLFTALPSLFDSIKGFGSSRTQADDLKNAFESIRNRPPRAWETASVSTGMQGMNVNFPQHEQEKAKAQEDVTEAFAKMSGSATKLAESLGKLGLGVVGAGIGLKMIRDSADASAHTLNMWDGGLAKGVAILERDRIFRQARLARDTAAESKEFIESENRAEEDFQSARVGLKKAEYYIGSKVNDFVSVIGKLFSLPTTIKEAAIGITTIGLGNRAGHEAEDRAQISAEMRAQAGEAARIVYDDQGRIDPNKTIWKTKPTDPDILTKAYRGDAAAYEPKPSPPPPAPKPPDHPENVVGPLRDVKRGMEQPQNPPLNEDKALVGFGLWAISKMLP